MKLDDIEPATIFLFGPLPAQEIGRFMTQLLRHRLVDIEDTAVVDVRRQHHHYIGRRIDGLLIGAHLRHFLFQPRLQQQGLLSFELGAQTDLLAVTVFFFFLCQMGEVGARCTGRLGGSTFSRLFWTLRVCVCLYVYG